MNAESVKPPESVLELLRKVRALAISGAPGERAAAQERLGVLLKKHGMTEQELENVATRLYGFKHRSDEEFMLLCAIVAHVAHAGEFPTLYNGNGKKNWSWVMLTAAQAIDVETWFAFYRKHWEKERRVFFRAFIFAQKLGTNPSAAPRELSEEEMRERRRIANLRMFVDQRSPRRELAEASGS